MERAAAAPPHGIEPAVAPPHGIQSAAAPPHGIQSAVAPPHAGLCHQIFLSHNSRDNTETQEAYYNENGLI